MTTTQTTECLLVAEGDECGDMTRIVDGVRVCKYCRTPVEASRQPGATATAEPEPTPAPAPAASKPTGTISGSPTKLRDGSWGARVSSRGLTVGDHVEVRVTTRAGKSWVASHEVIIIDGDTATCERTDGGGGRPQNAQAQRIASHAARERRVEAAARRRCGCTGCRTHGTCLAD